MAPGGEWLAVFTRAGFDQTQARQALGELLVTRQPDGSLDAVDISTAAACVENEARITSAETVDANQFGAAASIALNDESRSSLRVNVGQTSRV